MSVEEKQARSVFVGNIPHGTTEEQMKEIFSTVGTVLSFRIVCDKESGNPKGYGFAEYSDAEMALSAIRNLNGFEYGGRVLRVDRAASQADELRIIHQQTPTVETPYGPLVSPEKAPEAISRVVASLPPEKMYELMKEMKICIQNNVNEVRAMLVNNPQLAYALLQNLVLMKIIDPIAAQKLLHKRCELISPLMPVVTNAKEYAIENKTFSSKVEKPSSPNLSPSQKQSPTKLKRHEMLKKKPPTSQNISHQQTSRSEQLNVASIFGADQEKATLIMQVLQLTDEQIEQLTAEQQKSILMLKSKIAENVDTLFK